MTTRTPVVMDGGRRRGLKPGEALPLSVLSGAADGLPIGAPLPWPFASGPGDRYLRMDGSSHAVDDYPLLGALYGGAAGATFQIADWRGLPAWGAAAGESPGSVVGTDALDLSHAHAAGSLTTTTAGQHDHGGSTGSQGEVPVGLIGLTGNATKAHSHPISQDGGHSHGLAGSTASAGAGAADKRPRRAVVTWWQLARL